MKSFIKASLVAATMAAASAALPTAALAANGDTLTVTHSCNSNGDCYPRVLGDRACSVSWRLIGGTASSAWMYAQSSYEPADFTWQGPSVTQGNLGSHYMPTAWISMNHAPAGKTVQIRYRVDTGNCNLSTW